MFGLGLGKTRTPQDILLCLLSERGGEPWLTQQWLMAFPGGVSTEAVLLMGCLQSFPFRSWPQNEMKTNKKMIPRGLSIFLSYKLLVPLSRRSSQCPVYSVFQLQCLPTLMPCMEKKPALPEPESGAPC